MEQIVVKTEVQPNGDILLFYVDENQGHAVGELTRLENVTVTDSEHLQESDFVLSNVEESVDEYDLLQSVDQFTEESWQDEDIQKLLVFYIDNKDNFSNGETISKHLWVVACKTMLNGKSPTMCELKLRELKLKYIETCIEQQQGTAVKWAYFDLCNQAFHDDESVLTVINQRFQQESKVIHQEKPKEDGILVMKKVSAGRSAADVKVEHMLNLYSKFRKDVQKYHSHKAIWEAIAVEMGEEDSEYWHKRFLNFKQHYIRMVCKRNEVGPAKINWQYMKVFDQIFDGDEEFQRKFGPRIEVAINSNGIGPAENGNIWNDTEKTVLVKYYFDCFHEFQDPTVPNNFLWHEIGRLLEKKPENCKEKYREMKKEHLDNLLEGDYDLANRIPIAIIFDNIIAREVEIELKSPQKRETQSWKTEEIDELVQLLYDKIEMFKDSVCYFVAWFVAAKKLRKSTYVCKKQWEDLTTLYKSILEDKKEDPDMQIDWRYIDIFDRIFDYGMDTNLLEGYENVKTRDDNERYEKVGVRKVHVKDDDDNDECSDDEESYDERGFTKRSKRRTGESKGFKILEYYLKNKDKFSCSLRKKLSLWEILAKQLGITATQCAHRFRNLKQVYTSYVQREINKPDMPILWPYYALCKKVFGYRAIKSKLKNGKMDSDDAEEWTAKEIKQLINYFGNNYSTLHDNAEDAARWSQLANGISKTSRACCEKFLELRKSYRKLKTMKSRNPDVKVSWKYFNMIDDIYNNGENDQMQAAEVMDIANNDIMDVDAIKTELPEDDEFEYIIVIPENQELSGEIETSEVIMEEAVDDTIHIEDTVPIESKPQSSKWNRRTKKRLLIHYLKYLKSHKGKEIDSTVMWEEISGKLNKSPLNCRRFLIKLKNQHRMSASSDGFKEKSPYYSLIERILKMKPKFAKITRDKGLKEKRTYRDVALADEKLEKALQYYTEHLEEFLSPRFEKKYVWMELANFINEPVSKIFNKINYLKHSVNTDADSNQEVPFSSILQEILSKEAIFKNDDSVNEIVKNTEAYEEFWTDDEVEQLLTWYLANLDKFKNPKYVRSYLWMGAADVLKKSPLVCSKKMSEVRTQYRNMVKEAPEELNHWRFHNLCQKIYGTGKKPASDS